MRNADDILKKIGFILNDLQDQQEYFQHHPDRINSAELELFTANANFLADHVKVYLRLKETEAAQEPSQVPIVGQAGVIPETHVVENVPVADEEDPIAAAEELEERVDVQPEETIYPINEEEIFKPDTSPAPFEFILDQDDRAEEEQTPIAEEPVMAEAGESAAGEVEESVAELEMEEEEDEIGPEPFLIPVPAAVVEDTVVAEPKEVIAQRTTTTAEKEAPAKLTLNEMLARQTGNLTPATRKHTVTDLKQLINLNDKLLFIKDLFNGYNLAYAEAIDLVNKMENMEAADNFLQKNYAMKNAWSEKQGTVERLYDLLQQRFG